MIETKSDSQRSIYVSAAKRFFTVTQTKPNF